FELSVDLALKGYDEEMLAEYLRRLSIPEEIVGNMVDSIRRIHEALSEKPQARVPEAAEGFRKVAAGQGWQWVVEGFSIFRKSPLIWVVLCMILTGIGLTLSLIPVAGEIILYLASPIFAAGLMQGCRDVEQGGELELAHLFLGFRKDTRQLASIGMVYLFGQILILGIMVAFGGDTMSKLFFGTSDIDPSSIPSAEMSRVMLGLAAGMAVSVPLMMMIWFAPVLVVFRGMEARQAMQLSFSACLANMLPFLVFGSVFLAMAFLSGITFGLGLLLMVPLIFTSTYASYVDIFESRPHIDIRIG
ncbi:MAG TPA: BPSS1780 family membrane protein, partial [Burkholderiales bacterium]|nr:BPSS1780 family membrane protein [Burkholderiales bacterium]